MESSQLFGGTEECSSSESGWTTYIVSPAHSDDGLDDNYEEDDEEDDDDHDSDDDGKDGNNDSDDSMASDASSGSNHGEGAHLYEGGSEGGHDTTHFKHDQEEYDHKCYSYNKVYRQKEEKREEERGREAVKKGAVLNANSETSPVHRGVRVRKARWIEKAK